MHSDSASALSDALLVREISIADAEAAAQLSGELGYPVSAAEMRRRIEAAASLKDHIVYVACVRTTMVAWQTVVAWPTVVAWIDVGIIHHLQTEPYGEIGGFVVSHEYRNRGIGQRLVAEAEKWVTDRGIKRMLVRSQIAREAAHRFYLREGYSRTKTSAVFSKDLQ